MRYILYCFAICAPISAFGQMVNPTVIQQDTDIALHNTDVYYCPFAPPGPNDTRDGLCNEASTLADVHGRNLFWDYSPITRDTVLARCHPCAGPADTLGPYVTWQRYFTAKRKVNGSTSTITAGGNIGDSVIISKNEDVDFRASGAIRLESGFHVKPGAFFHAYTEPKWDTTVFSDEFDSSHLDRHKWYVSGGQGDVEIATFQCSSDSDVRDTLDLEAHDGHALDIDLREVPSDCSCLMYQNSITDNCSGSPDTLHPATKHFHFATSNIRSCPMPWLTENSPWTPFYPHAPYGKYEIREKIPHIMHHTNDWGGGGVFEWDMGETVFANDSMKSRDITFILPLRHGPFIGTFGTVIISGDTVPAFRCPTAQFSWFNAPWHIYIDNFSYGVALNTTPTDTFLVANGPYPQPFPSFLQNRTVTFEYDRSPDNTTDSIHWVATDNRTLRVPFRVSGTDTSWFSKEYQPTSVILTYDHAGHRKTLRCYWNYWINTPIDHHLLTFDDTLLPTEMHYGTEAYRYTVDEVNGQPTPVVPFDGNDTTGGYVYHTYTMELLPHELRYLIDGNVVRRYPDRLVPPSSKYFDPISFVPRGGTTIQPAEFGVHQSTYADSLGTHNDALGIHPGTATYQERQYFESHLSNPGMWAVEVPPGSGKWYNAAHHLIDYVKLYDVPKDVTIPKFPH